MKFQEVPLENERGQKIYAYMRSNLDDNTIPVFVIHGTESSVLAEHNKAVMDALAEIGHTVIGVDMTGPKDTNAPHLNKSDVDLYQMYPDQMVSDVKSALALYREAIGYDGPIRIIGHSRGVYVALEIAKDPANKVREVIGYGADAVSEFNPKRFEMPVSFIVAGNDDKLRNIDTQDFHAEHAKGELKVIQGADHNFTGHEQELAEMVATMVGAATVEATLTNAVQSAPGDTMMP